jgi:uncharacterized protein YecT (DUF1311 family)
MTRFAIFTLCVIVLSAEPLLAAARDCAAAMSQTEMSICAGDEHKAADVELTKVYHDLMMKASESGKISLRDAERAWIFYRDKECSFATTGTSGGSVHPMVLSQCLTQKTNARIAELKAQLNCEEGDLSCGGQ